MATIAEQIIQAHRYALTVKHKTLFLGDIYDKANNWFYRARPYGRQHGRKPAKTRLPINRARP